MWENWVIDATLYHDDQLLCFVPIENIESINPTIVWGMNFLTSIEGFDKGKIVGIIHADGDEAVDKFCKAHPEILDKLEKLVLGESDSKVDEEVKS